jgi:hypothetical protein
MKESTFIKKLKDSDGHWYWIPLELLEKFKSDLEKIEGIDYMDDPDAFDLFSETFEAYRTHGDKNLTPEIFKQS